MRVTLKAIADYLQAGLDALPGTRGAVHRDYAQGVAAPYVILTAASHPRYGSEPLGGATSGQSGGSIVTINVGVSTDQARWVADRVRSVWAPNLRPLRFVAAGRTVEVVWDEDFSTGVSVDRDVTLPGSNTHPGVAHEAYTFTAHAIEPDES